MRFRMIIGFLLAIAVVAGCQGPPPTLVYIVVTATAETAPQTDTTAAASPDMTEALAAPSTATPVPPTATALPLESATPTALPTNTLTPTVGPTALPANFPTPWVEQITVAEQLYEHGRMFWVGPIKQIWVLKIISEGRGTW